MIRIRNFKVQPTIFPDETSQVWKIPEECFLDSTIKWDFENEGELIQVAQLAALCHSKGHRVGLEIPFLPYGRQDKEISNSTTFALSPFADLINAMNFSIVSTLDAHSDVSSKIKNLLNLVPMDEIGFAMQVCCPNLLGFPDRGAEKRYSFLQHAAIIGQKKRNADTGFISYFGMHGDEPKNNTILIVDDICDGGVTFCLFAEMLLKAGAKEVHLYTTHGIYSKGLTPLRKSGIKRIFNRKGEVK